MTVRVRVRVRVRVLISSVRDRCLERSGNRTLVDGVVSSRWYRQIISAQGLKETNRFTRLPRGSKLISKGVDAATDCVSLVTRDMLGTAVIGS